MTTINHINESGQTFGASQTKTEKSQGSDAFGNALSKALDNTEAPEMESSPASALQEIASMGLSIKSHSDIISTKTDDLLQMLDAYSSKLEDPNVSLKSIAPVLEQIRANAGNLEKEAKSLTDADTLIKQIATQTVLTAQTEYFKFQRGDYLS
jgi:hypothetical protein